jgi:replicative DNA helicase
MKFVGHLGKFEDLDTFDAPFEFQSKMNPDDNQIPNSSLPNPDDVFGALDDDDEDAPF